MGLTSICLQIELVEPDAIRLLLKVAVHLGSDINLFLEPVRLNREVRVDVICLVGH